MALIKRPTKWDLLSESTLSNASITAALNPILATISIIMFNSYDPRWDEKSSYHNCLFEHVKSGDATLSDSAIITEIEKIHIYTNAPVFVHIDRAMRIMHLWNYLNFFFYSFILFRAFP